jgi:hypothetical protein
VSDSPPVKENGEREKKSGTPSIRHLRHRGLESPHASIEVQGHIASYVASMLRAIFNIRGPSLLTQ